jgi:hypothetical protein
MRVWKCVDTPAWGRSHPVVVSVAITPYAEVAMDEKGVGSRVVPSTEGRIHVLSAALHSPLSQ